MADVIVVGAGAIGLCAAHELGHRGLDVTVIDKGEPGQACSFRNTGWIVPSFSGPLPAPGLTLQLLKWLLSSSSPMRVDPRALPSLGGWLWDFWRHCDRASYRRGLKARVALHQAMKTPFEDLLEHGVKFELHQQGLLLVASSPAKVEHEFESLSECLQLLDYDAPTLLSRNEIRELEPALGDHAVGGVFVGQDRHLRPESFVQGLAQHLEQDGITVQSGTDVSSFVLEGDEVTGVQTSRGVVKAPQVVLCAGAWTPQLTRQLGTSLPVIAGKGYSLTIDEPTLKLNHPVYLADAKTACSSYDGSLRLAGLMELSGVDTRVQADRVRIIRQAATQYFGSDWDQGAGESQWAGMRPLTPDGLPIIGQLPRHPNVCIATGHAMLGITYGPVTGALVAELVSSGEEPGIISPFLPDRF